MLSLVEHIRHVLHARCLCVSLLVCASDGVVALIKIISLILRRHSGDDVTTPRSWIATHALGRPASNAPDTSRGTHTRYINVS